MRNGILEYSNPQIPEGINTSKEHPLKEFLLLTTGVLGIVVIAVVAISLLAQTFAHYIPFSAEKNIAFFEESAQEKGQPINIYLQALADRISIAEELPEDMSIIVHYVNDDVVNAYATLGGNIVLFRGLLEKLPHENALSMVMAHEIAHIKHRHPISALGRGVVIGLALSLINSSVGNSILDGVIGDTGLLTSLHFSRGQEQEADDTALAALVVLYGHTTGAEDLFKVLEQEQKGYEPPEFFSTHPLTQSRIGHIHALSSQHGDKKPEQITDLPEHFSKWLDTAPTENGDSVPGSQPPGPILVPTIRATGVSF